MAEDRLPPLRSASIISISADTGNPRWRAISRRPLQNASSRLTLVLWRATATERLTIADLMACPPASSLAPANRSLLRPARRQALLQLRIRDPEFRDRLGDRGLLVPCVDAPDIFGRRACDAAHDPRDVFRRLRTSGLSRTDQFEPNSKKMLWNRASMKQRYLDYVPVLFLLLIQWRRFA